MNADFTQLSFEMTNLAVVYSPRILAPERIRLVRRGIDTKVELD